MKDPDPRPVKKGRSGARLARRKQRVAREAASRAQSNGPVGSLNLHDWCFGLAQRAPSLYGASEGSASEAADVETKRFGFSTAPSAAAESAFPEGAIASILRDASGRKRPSEPMLADGRWAFRGEPQGRTFFNGLLRGRLRL